METESEKIFNDEDADVFQGFPTNGNTADTGNINKLLMK